MAHEENLANDYVDGNLSPDLKASFERLLNKDEVLARQVAKLGLIKNSLSADNEELKNIADNTKARVFGRVMDHLESKPKKRNFGLFLPVPALAAFVVAIVAVPFTTIALNDNGRGNTPSISKETKSQIEPLNVSTIPNSIDVSANSSLPVLKNGKGIEVTIQVNTLDELLQVLEGSGGSREVKIQLPQTDVLTPIGDPAVIQAVNK